MSARSFLDTNVLLYTDDRDAPAKQRRALDLVSELRRAGAGVLSLQVLQEYFVGATRKLRVDPAVARRKLELFARFEVVQLGVDDLVASVDLHRLHGVAFWDALVLRAAGRGDCSVLYSEDLQHGRSYDGVRVLNPFR